jgi:glycosyltransferase involved in cell wall biosynthesis
VTVIENGRNGYLATDPKALIGPMRALLADPEKARKLGQAARATALERFNLQRFAADWERLFRQLRERPRRPLKRRLRAKPGARAS